MQIRNIFKYIILCSLNIRERFLIVKIENIIDIMINILKLMQNNLKKFKRTMTTQINKHKKIMIYNFENKIWLFNNNIIIVRFSKKLKNKMLNSFEILKIVDIFYRLKLLFFMKIHFVFHINFFRNDSNDFLFDQIIDASKSMKTKNDDEWLIDDILNFRRWHNRLQYKIKWHDFEKNDDWYNTNRNEFFNAQKMINDFHVRYFHKIDSKSLLTLRSKKKFM